MDVSEKRERAAVHRAGKTARRKKTDAFGALFGSASSSAARHEALSMRIRRAVTREGGLCREEPPKERRKRRNIRRFGGSPLSLARRSPPDGGVASSSLSLLCFFRHALWPSLCDASAFFDRSRRHLAACALETEMNGRRRGGMEELMLLLLLPLARSLAFFFSSVIFGSRRASREELRARSVAPCLSSSSPSWRRDRGSIRSARWPKEKTVERRPSRACAQHPISRPLSRGGKRAATRKTTPRPLSQKEEKNLFPSLEKKNYLFPPGRHPRLDHRAPRRRPRRQARPRRRPHRGRDPLPLRHLAGGPDGPAEPPRARGADQDLRRRARAVLGPAAAVRVRGVPSGGQLPVPWGLRGPREAEPRDDLPAAGVQGECFCFFLLFCFFPFSFSRGMENRNLLLPLSKASVLSSSFDILVLVFFFSLAVVINGKNENSSTSDLIIIIKN